MKHISKAPSRRIVIGTSVIAGAVMATGVLAADWPQWQGPDRTGVSKETGLLKTWSEGGPKVLWKATALGEGHTTPSVAAGKVYGMGLSGGDESVWCLDDKTGKPVWSTKIADGIQLGGAQGGFGSRATPTVDGNKVYVLGVGGEMVCMDAMNGKILWHKSFTKDFGGSVPTWGYSESPLVDGPNVIAAPGSRSASIVAFNKMTGDVAWKCVVPEGDSAHYTSAILADVDGQKQIIHFLSGGVIGVSAKDGKYLWRYDAPANHTANCSTPIYRDHMVFAASGYNTGGGLAKLSSNGGGTAATEVYFTKKMQNHHGGMVLVGDYLYGFDGSNLTCLDFKTGDVKWADRSVGKGSVSYADGNLYVRGERGGPLALVEATPEGYKEKGRFTQTDLSGAPTWPHPVIANGKLYIRDMNTLICYDIKK